MSYPALFTTPGILEEAYEAGAERDLEEFRAELIQIAAVCQTIITDLDRRGGAR
ncbi:hypothetical protein ABZZ79_03380 [Streptomyces sp. NPDC006458]|uniref:hypothetical protein n=1 Tax=Streptomyces sp. NPDC006458 TaxID=3154302 RepID=UPI0033A30C44